MWGALNFVKKVNMSESTTAPTNDIIYRRIVLTYYHTATEAAVEVQTFITTPKRTRRGKIETRGYPFRTSFAKLFKFTRNIKGISQHSSTAQEITNWLNIVPDFKDEAETTGYYLKGIALLDDWSKILIDQSIIEFR